MQYKEIRVPLSSGDTLIFYSDGISEARNMDGEEFGDRQFKELLARVIPGDLDANGILEALLHDLYEFSGSTVQQDDATLVIVKIR